MRLWQLAKRTRAFAIAGYGNPMLIKAGTSRLSQVRILENSLVVVVVDDDEDYE